MSQTLKKAKTSAGEPCRLVNPILHTIDKHRPNCFNELYPKCRGIIDASEIKVQAPSSLVLNSCSYSCYKSHNTFKGNKVIAPSGEIIHVSLLYVDSISNKELVKKSGLLKLLKPGDQLMADKGFVIPDGLTLVGCSITMLTFLSSKTQFPKDKLLKSTKIHNVRVHIERAIRRVKEFHYFDRVTFHNGRKHYSNLDSSLLDSQLSRPTILSYQSLMSLVKPIIRLYSFMCAKQVLPDHKAQLPD